MCFNNSLICGEIILRIETKNERNKKNRSVNTHRVGHKTKPQQNSKEMTYERPQENRNKCRHYLLDIHAVTGSAGNLV